MKAYLFLILFLFMGCSNKILVPIIKTPNEINNSKITHLKINLKNDSIYLKQNILNQMYNINDTVSNYFKFNEYQAILNGNVKINVYKSIYKKIVKLNPKKPICIYKFYKCKAVANSMFCSNTSTIILKPAEYNKIKKDLLINKNYVIYDNHIYKLIKQCKPTHTTIRCEKTDIRLNTFINITDLNNHSLFSKNYFLEKIIDPCKNIYNYQNQKIYKTKSASVYLNTLSKILAKQIVNDIAPHQEYFSSILYDDIDVNMNDKDENIFKNIISQASQTYILNPNNLSLLKTLHDKYPNSCVISYDLSLYLIANKDYHSSKKILYKLLKSNCNDDIKNSIYNTLSNLNNLYY